MDLPHRNSVSPHFHIVRFNSWPNFYSIPHMPCFTCFCMSSKLRKLAKNKLYLFLFLFFFSSSSAVCPPGLLLRLHHHYLQDEVVVVMVAVSLSSDRYTTTHKNQKPNGLVSMLGRLGFQSSIIHCIFTAKNIVVIATRKNKTKKREKSYFWPNFGTPTACKKR